MPVLFLFFMRNFWGSFSSICRGCYFILKSATAKAFKGVVNINRQREKKSLGKTFVYFLLVVIALVVAFIMLTDKNGDQADKGKEIKLSVFEYKGIKYGMTRQEVMALHKDFKELKAFEGDESKGWAVGDLFGYFGENDTIINFTIPQSSDFFASHNTEQKVIAAFGEGEVIQSQHDPNFHVLHYSAGENNNIWFLIGNGETVWIQVGQLIAD